MESLGFDLRQEAFLRTLTTDVLGSSEIEGEKLEANQVRSSIARRLGMDIGALKPADRHVEGIVEMMLDATGHYDQPLAADRLFGWHAVLFPTGRSGMRKIRVGAWRDFWESVRGGVSLNERQTLVLNRLLDGFEGKLTTSKYAKLTTSSQDTALRDILRLVERGILVRGPEGGRSTSYALTDRLTAS